MGLKFKNGEMSVDGLFHYHSSNFDTPAKKRVLRFTLILPNGNILEETTNPILVESKQIKKNSEILLYVCKYVCR